MAAKYIIIARFEKRIQAMAITQEELDELTKDGFVFVGSKQVDGDFISLDNKIVTGTTTVTGGTKVEKKKKGAKLHNRRRLNGKMNLSREAIEAIVFNPGIVNQFVKKYGCSKATIQRLRARSGRTKAQKLHFIRQISKPTSHHKQA